MATQGADDGQVFIALSVGTALFVVLQYPFGWLSDRFGRKPQMFVWTAGIAVLIVPLSTLITPDVGMGGLLLVFCTGLGIGAWYNLTVATFGGTAPLVIQSLSDAGHSNWFFWYVAVGAVIGFFTVLSLKDTKGTVLR